jgi:hypothetical protein
MVIMVRVYYRMYITYTLTGFLFDLDQSNVDRDIEKIEGLIKQCLSIPQKLYNVTKRLKAKKKIEKYFPGFMAFTDGTEQPIPRPAKNKIKEDYSTPARKEAHRQEPVYSKPKRMDNLQDKTQTKR